MLVLGLVPVVVVGLHHEAGALLLPPLLIAGGLPLSRLLSVQGRYERLLRLDRLSSMVSGSQDLVSTLERLLAQCALLVHAESAEIVVLRSGRPVARQRVGTRGAGAPTVGDEVWQRTVVQRDAVLLRRGSDDLGGYLRRHGVRDLICVPLIQGTEVLGVLMVRHRARRIGTFGNEDVAVLRTMANQMTVVLENLRLIDRLRSESAEREHQALHDDLTGLPNRSHLYRAIQQLLNDPAQRPIAVMLIDLDRFKEVNDTLGHHAGDEVLVEAARRLEESAPEGAVVARLGGDEFALVLPDTGDREVVEQVGRRIMGSFADPFELQTMNVRIDLSIGFALFPEQGRDRSTLLKRADVAMYAAKSTRGSALRCYEPVQERTSERSLALVGDLRAALESGALEVVFQPKASLVTGRVSGVEALARWEHPTLGAIPPDEFIPLAEQAGLIGALTDIVLERSLAAHDVWRRSGVEMTVSVNVDPGTLADPLFVRRVTGLLERHDVHPSVLTLEMTERDVVQELELVRSVADGLRSIGVRLSIDDFGTGYSSLSYLVRLPVDEIKLDRSFVSEVAWSPRHAIVVQAVADLASRLGLHTVVEGIEDLATWDALRAFGCEEGQGWFLSRPVSAQALLDWLRTRQVGSETAVVPGAGIHGQARATGVPPTVV